MNVSSGSVSLVTGGAGLIGASLVASLIADGEPVIVVDQVPWPKARRLHDLPTDLLTYHAIDLQDADRLRDVLASRHSHVYHLASNTENRADRAAPDADYRITAGATVAVLQALAGSPPDAFVLASSQLVYGLSDGALDEDDTPPRPNTRFGAGKLAAEAFLSAYAHECGFRSVAARLSNIVGPGLRRGILYDLVAHLGQDPTQVRVLGDGRQSRSYVHVDDCVAALRLAARECLAPFDVVNVCNHDVASAATAAEIVREEYPGPGRPEVVFGGGRQGWAGDVPTLEVKPARLTAWGWNPALSSADAIRATVRALFEEVA